MTEFDKNQLIFNINCIKKPPKVFLSGACKSLYSLSAIISC